MMTKSVQAVLQAGGLPTDEDEQLPSVYKGVFLPTEIQLSYPKLVHNNYA